MKGPKPKPAIERFMRHVEMVTESGCWIWTGGLSSGYGNFHNGFTQCMAHRFSYESYRGPIANGMDIDHLCRVRCCVNPWHLEVVTRRENVLRGIGPCAINAKKLHCVNGHELAGDNLYIWSGKRRCKSCRRDVNRKWYWRNVHVAS